MNRISKVLFFGIKLGVVVSLVGISAFSEEQNKRIKVVYGKDDRLDVYQVSNPALINLADATAAMIPLANLSTVNQLINVKAGLFGESYGLCKDEPFYNQPNGAMCSVFLVGPDLVATAGHCITDVDCSENAFVFNYKMTGPGRAPAASSPDDVYQCKKIIARELTREQDYALVQLDRPVVGHTPLTLSKTPAKAGDSLILIGHPAGLPTKIAGGANVRKVEKGYFSANTDSYGGNSGSAVFNATTNEVVGILVRGEEDFKYDSTNWCLRSNYCADGDCRGEDVTQIEYILNSLKSMQ